MKILESIELLVFTIMSDIFIFGYLLSFFQKMSPEHFSKFGISTLIPVGISTLILAGFYFVLKIKGDRIARSSLYILSIIAGIFYFYIYFPSLFYVFPDGSKFLRHNKLIFVIITSISPTIFIYLLIKNKKININ